MSSRAEALALYKQLLRCAAQFPQYNFRMYALRRVRDAYRERRSLTDPAEVTRSLVFGRGQLEVIRRQVMLGKLFPSEPNVLEKRDQAERGVAAP